MGGPQHVMPIAELLREDLESPDPDLTIYFVKKKSFKPNLASREDFCVNSISLRR